MADEKDVTPKRRLPRMDMDKARERANRAAALLRKFAVLIGLVGMFIVGFLLGARTFELGHFKNAEGLKGATVKVSGHCKVNGMYRDKGLVEDEVKVSSVDVTANGIVLKGVLRLTREVIDCNLSESSFDTMPLIQDFFSSPVTVPTLTAAVQKREPSPYESLKNQIIVASGSCRGQVDGKELAPFTDEKIDVTSVERIPNEENFVISGIRRSDKMALACSSKSIRWSVWDGTDAPIAMAPQPKVTFVNKILRITSKCPIDRRASLRRGQAFVSLNNSKVQVIDEVLRNDRLVKFTGSVLDEGETFGTQVVCDADVYPFTYDLDSDKYSGSRSKTSVESENPAPATTRSGQGSQPNQQNQEPTVPGGFQDDKGE